MSKWSTFINKVKNSRFFNKYLLIILLFFLWIAFFDDNSFIDRFRTERELNRVQKDINTYMEDIERTSALIEALDSNASSIEQFARQTYHMKAVDEDVYLIKE